MSHLESLGMKILSDIIIIEQFGWPPSCFGSAYQPERPICSHRPQDDESRSKKRDK